MLITSIITPQLIICYCLYEQSRQFKFSTACNQPPRWEELTEVSVRIAFIPREIVYLSLFRQLYDKRPYFGSTSMFIQTVLKLMLTEKRKNRVLFTL